jgi:uncharacterized protein
MSHEPLPPQYLRGVELFNAGRFFECHEVLEELWLSACGDERTLLHALIQAAAALHHLQNGNRKGACSVYGRARRKLEASPPRLLSLDTRGFARELAEFFDAATAGYDAAGPEWPKIRLEDAA